MNQGRNGLKEPRKPSKEELQTAFLCYEVTFYLLKEAGILMNGYVLGGDSPQPPSHACLTEPDFFRAYERLKEGCMDLKARHEEDMVSMVKELDIRDFALYETFHKVCSTIVSEEINWGRITSLFTFTGYLATRLHNEGQSGRIKGVIAWEAQFVSERVLPWVQRHGGWVSFLAFLGGVGVGELVYILQPVYLGLHGSRLHYCVRVCVAARLCPMRCLHPCWAVIVAERHC